MAETSVPPFIWLGPRWYAWLEFGPDNRHATFVAIAQRIASELGGTVIECMPNPSDDGKEYFEIEVGSSQLLLMRKTSLYCRQSRIAYNSRVEDRFRGRS